MEKQCLKVINIKDNEKYLRQTSKLVDIKNDTNLNNDIKILESYCKTNRVMAMAAIQLGISKRIIYIKNTNLDIINKMQINNANQQEINYNEGRVLINPTITERRGLTEYWEACASCLDNCGRVLRPYIIMLEYYDINGEKHYEKFEGFESTVLSHEYDHLNGILHIDIAEEIRILPVEERKILRQLEGYKILSDSGDYNKLKKELKKQTIKIDKTT